MGVLLQTVKSQMKCYIKKIFRLKNRIFFLKKDVFKNNYLTPLDMYNGLFQVCCIKSEG